MVPEDWAITQLTTNLGKSHWTNQHTGIKHSLMEAIVTARKLDDQTAAKIQASCKTGVLTNNRNNTYNCMS
ncbi:hypothetical protein L208DRAFT_1470291 [Tricholoma matsutake]|nr:hypothetical protein L208DRAFT_1470291 [Tricholoma matsutake 945]